jgi:hypothetical protein
MTMPIRWLALAALLACGVSLRADEPSPLKVLYAGHLASDREQDFTTFLETHFAKVGTTDYRTFTEDQAKGYDVVIFDWTSVYARDKDGKIKEPFTGLIRLAPPRISEQYDRPTILIGAAGGLVAKRLRLKLDWR